MRRYRWLVIAALTSMLVGGASYALVGNPRQAVDFHPGHTHVDGVTIEAPEHSGGTDRWGCHNASVPYHCH